MRQRHTRWRRPWVVRLLAVLTAVMTILVTGGEASAAAPRSTTRGERYRPQYHYSPAENWMNDPNGLVRYRGEYHLFYQYNPQGNTWGHMSWGHAVSRDLVHWRELPVAIPEDADNMIFSGSVVVDRRNTSGFGRPGHPAMVAVYTASAQAGGHQAQALAYSVDGGRTWTKYAGNPVLDIGAADFRDPKVFWYAPDERWTMVVALPTEHKVSLYSSTDLKHWTHRSDFGPAGATGGVWECPDLFPLAVDGDPRHTKWVLVVNLNPGGVAGGSGAQYFVGDFDGRTFHADGHPYQPPRGDVIADFEGNDYGSWTTTGTAFGDGPAHGTLPNQMEVSGYLGDGLVNSFRGGDGTQGTLTSPEFTITRPYINMLLGGGRHPRTQPGEAAVELVVDGTVVRSVTGSDSEALDWASMDVRDLVGRRARLRAVDANGSGWGHILLDQVTFADAPAKSATERAHWVDYGADFYAVTTYNNMPAGRRVAVAWMNNWAYGESIPTSPWRSADTVPREFTLRTIDGRPRLVQRPVRELASLRRGPAHGVHRMRVTGTRTLPRVHGRAMEISVDIDPGSADRVGIAVRVGDGQRTVIGYDRRAGELYVDRSHSGDVDFDPDFGGVQRAPVTLTDGRLHLRVLLDRSSIEVFAGHGETVLTDQIFPDASSRGVRVFADGGTAVVRSLKAWRMRSAWP